MGCVSSKKKLSKADLEFLQENTEFTKDQIMEWYEGFIVSIQKKDNHMVHHHSKITFPVPPTPCAFLIIEHAIHFQIKKTRSSFLKKRLTLILFP
jgi:hypothetical protein